MQGVAGGVPAVPAGRGGAAPREAVQAADQVSGAVWGLVEAGAPAKQGGRGPVDVRYTHVTSQNWQQPGAVSYRHAGVLIAAETDPAASMLPT